MTSVFEADPGFGYVCHARPDGHYLALERVLLIHKLILSGRLYCPGPYVSHACSPDPLSLCFYSEVARAGVRHNWPLCPVHVVVGPVGQPDCIVMVLARGPRRQIVAVACILGNSLSGARGCILRQPGPWSICR